MRKNKKIFFESLFKNFPFREPANTAAVTCSHVLHDGLPVLYVSHDADDGMWQFLCGGTHTEEQARVVSLSEINQLDCSIADVAEIPCGCIAVRNDLNASWIVRKR